jgi:hypothetical protein
MEFTAEENHAQSCSLLVLAKDDNAADADAEALIPQVPQVGDDSFTASSLLPGCVRCALCLVYVDCCVVVLHHDYACCAM